MRRLGEYSRERRALVTLAEVDDPRRHTTEALIGDPRARLAFYGRLGARVLDLPFFQPRLVADGPRAHGMLLLTLDVHSDALEGGALLFAATFSVVSCAPTSPTVKARPERPIAGSPIRSWTFSSIGPLRRRKYDFYPSIATRK